MAQFALLTGIAPPFLLLGIPAEMLRSLTRWKKWEERLAKPLTIYLVANLVFLAWHVPVVFELASRNVAIWWLKQGMFLAAGFVAWWIVLGRTPSAKRSPYPVQILYLFFMSVPTTILGAIFTFAEVLVYSATALAFEICAPASPADQQTAGLVMWMSGAAVYLTALTFVFFRWFGEMETTSETREF